MPLNILACISYKYILLHNHNTVIISNKLSVIPWYYLTVSLYLSFPHCLPDDFYSWLIQSGIKFKDHALHLHVIIYAVVVFLTSGTVPIPCLLPHLFNFFSWHWFVETKAVLMSYILNLSDYFLHDIYSFISYISLSWRFKDLIRL